MNKKYRKSSFCIKNGLVAGLFLTTTLHAGSPVWTFSAPSPASVTISSGSTATVQYVVTNQSTKPKHLKLKITAGLSTSSCDLAGGKGSTCTLTLTVNGNSVPSEGIHAGPVLCEEGNPNQCYQPAATNQLSVIKSTNPTITYTITASGDSNVAVTSTNPQMVSYGGTTTFTVAPASGYTVTGSGCGGTLSGTTYTTGAVTAPCSVSFSSVPFPAAEGPSNVFITPGNGQAVASWIAPSNTGTGTITGYIVTYGPTSGTTFNTVGCTATAPSLTCTVTGLTNDTAYTFAVSTVTQQSGVSQTGPASLSSSITPTAELSISPSTLALSSLAGNHSSRTITLTNNSSSPIILSAVPASYSDFTPALPSDVTISTTCNTTSALAANGGFCTVTITPGTTASNDNTSSACTGGSEPVSSKLEVVTGSSVNAVVLGYGCIYQGGYVFSIDDTAPTSESIGGKVVSTTDQSSSIFWSPSSVYDTIWGIDNTSTPITPSPSAANTSYPATFQAGQLNCNAVNDGACATHNIHVLYSASSATSYAVGLCQQPLTGDNGATACTGSATCYTDWYLPSTCDLGPFGSTGLTGNYPSPSGSQSCALGSTNIQQQLVSSSIASISGFYWSSTEESSLPKYFAWFQYFASSGDFQVFNDKNYAGIAVRCVRSLTN